MMQISFHKNLVWLLPIVVLSANALAQPAQVPLTPGQQAEQAATQRVLQGFEELRQKTQELERRDAQAAINAYQKFYEEQAYRTPGAGIEIASLVARLYYVELQDKARALEIYDWALEQFKGASLWQASWQKLWKEREQIKAGKPLPDAVKIEATSNANIPNATLGEVKTPSPLVGGALLQPVQIGQVVQAPWQKWQQKTLPVPGVNVPGVSVPGVGLPGVNVPFAAALPGVQLKPNAIGESALYQAILTQIKSDALTVEQAWGQGHLSGDVVLNWINSHTLRWPDDGALANALIEQVNQHEPKKLSLEALKTLPPENRVRIGDYFSARRDERAVEIYQHVMNEPGQNGAVPDWYGQAGARLGAFYEGKGESQKALTAYLDVVEKLPKDGRYAASVALAAARLYLELGEEQKAQEFFAMVRGYGVARYDFLSLTTPFAIFMERGELEKAQAVISAAPVPHQTPLLKATRLGLQGSLARRQGQFEAAEKYFYEALALLKEEPDADLKGALQDLTDNELEFLRHWKAQRVYCEPSQIDIFSPTDPERRKAVWHRVRVRSYAPFPLTMSSSDTRVKVRPAQEQVQGKAREKPWQMVGDFLYEKEVIIEVAREHLHEPFDAEVILRHKEKPEEHWTLHLPVYVDLRDDEE
jgi:tetratricopeptide (TPR) repeat protein